ncbi:MAG: type III secretion system inner membrane ring subunit SctD [Luteimonas sp.]|nr:type III secretion system inner membrane ring subunit SctD [Luteimonas sp.]
MSSPNDTSSDSPSTNSPQPASLQPASLQPDVLRILSGLHGGASRLLAAQEMIVIGSGEDCDIVLADAGVARHHALVISLGGVFSLRALDAPLRIDGRLLHPGDPVALAPFQRIELGEVAFAVGAEEDDRWSALLPSYHGNVATRASAKRSYLRHLPTIAGLAVLSLASVAIFAAVVPKGRTGPQPIDRLDAIAAQYRITDGATTVTPEGLPVLSGSVDDVATREQIRQRIGREGIVAKIDLRTGEDIAHDVQEVLRSQGLNARTRYLGKGDVEVSGRFEDEQALRTAATSRAMIDVVGVKRVIPRNFAAEPKVQATAGAAVAQKKPEAQIVAVVRGAEPHALAADGTRYAVGSELPGGGKLIAIGTHAWALMPDGQTKQIKPSMFANVAGSSAGATLQTATEAAKPAVDAKADPTATPKATTKAVAEAPAKTPVTNI